MIAHAPNAPAPIVAIGPLPPPISGGTTAFRSVCEDLARCGLLREVIDIAPRQSVSISGTGVMLQRIRSWLGALQRLHRATGPAGSACVYMLLGQSRSSLARDVACAWIANRRHASIVAHVHGGAYELLYVESGSIERRLIRWLLRHLASIIVLDDALRTMFAFDPTVRDRVAVVPNGLPPDAWLASNARALVPGAPLRVLFLSSLIETKGYLQLVRATALLRNAGIAVELHLAGEIRESPDDETVQSAAHAERQLRAVITELGLDDAVIVHGLATGEHKRQLLEECDVFVLPTWYRFEGQPIAIIEAMAAALPVVATRHRAIPGLLGDSDAGILIDEPAPAAIASAIASLADADRYARASRAALTRARTSFATATFTERVRTVLLQSPPRVRTDAQPSVLARPLVSSLTERG